MQERLAELEQIHHNLFSNIGLGILKPVSDVQKYLNLSESQLKVLSPDDCSIGANILSAEATFVQTQINRYQAAINWAGRNLSHLVDKIIENYREKFTPYEVARSNAIEDKPNLKEFYDFITDTQFRLDMLSFLPSYLRGQAQTLGELAKHKLKA